MGSHADSFEGDVNSEDMHHMVHFRSRSDCHTKALLNALALPSRFGRRHLVGCAAAAAASLTAVQPSFAKAKGGVQWVLDVPPSFAIERQLGSIVRIKTETMLLAEAAESDAQIKLLLLPFGQQAGSSLDGDEQLKLAEFFFDQGSIDAAAADAVSKALVASAARSPSVTALNSVGKTDAYAADGRRYVQYSYVAEKCAGEIDGGKCLGTTSKRRTMAIATLSSISQFRTNTERERMQAEGRVRNVQVLWLLTLSAPEGAAWKSVEPIFEKAGASFRVPVGDQL